MIKSCIFVTDNIEPFQYIYQHCIAHEHFMYYDELCNMPVVPTCDMAWLGGQNMFLFVLLRLTGETVIVLVQGRLNM